MMEKQEPVIGSFALNKQVLSLADLAWKGVLNLIQPWSFIQLVIIAALFGAAWLISRSIEPRIENWMRSQQASKQRLRIYVLALRRLRTAVFIVLAGLTTLVMQELTWPSRSYLIGVAAQLTAIWLIVYFSARLIQNRLVAKIVAFGAWSWVALNLVGAMPRVIALMDALALQLGNVRLSLLSVTKAGIVLSVLFWGASLASSLTENRITRASDISPSMRVLISKLVRVCLFTLAIVIGLQSVGFDLTALTIFSGAIGLGLGFGLQKVVSNLVSGVILLLDKSVKPGDVISLGDTFGWISSLGARYVSVVTRDGREFLIPNEDLITNRVINWSYSNQLVRLEVPFGVAYDSDPHLVRKLAVEAAMRPGRVHKVPAPVCHLAAFGDSSIDFVLRFWINDPNNGVVNIQGEVLLALWDAFKANNIAIPFPQRDLHIRTGLPVAPSPVPAQPASEYRTKRSSSSKRARS
jgi:small-conductance mechanosensitive channel